MITQEQARSRVLRAAIRDNVVDTDIHPFGDAFVTNLMGYTRDRRGAHLQNPNEFEPWQHPKSQRWQESSFAAATHATTTEHFAVEVARFLVPKGSVGFVRYIEQVLNDANGNYYPTNQEYWGSPQFVLSDVDNCRWYLKLDYFDGATPAIPFTLSTAAAFSAASLPGAPYSDLPIIDATWYPANNDKEIKLIVPGQRMLRFFFYSPPTTLYQWQVRGKLSGWVQSSYSCSAARNARRID